LYQMVNLVNGGSMGVDREQRPKNQRGAPALAAKPYGQGSSAEVTGLGELFKSEKTCAVIARFRQWRRSGRCCRVKIQTSIQYRPEQSLRFVKRCEVALAHSLGIHA